MKIKTPKQINQPSGCLECRNTGYLGRVGIYEMLKTTPKFKSFIREDTEREKLFEVAVREGMHPLNISGASKVAAGQTTVEEVMRVVSIS